MNGVYFFKARFYDSSIGRFLSTDSIIPPNQGTQGFDRFAYVNNNPVNFNDPTGHMQASDPYKSGEYIKPTPTNTPTATSTPTTTPTPSNTPTSTPTSTYTLPPTAIIPWPTYTPTPQGYSYDPVPTTVPTPGPILTSPKGISVFVDWDNLIDMGQIDIVDAVVDVVGIGGDIAYRLGKEGKVVWFLTELPETAGFIYDGINLGKNIYDISYQNDPSGLLLNTAQEQFSRTLVDGGRLSPAWGSVFNLASLGSNIGPAINFDAITIIGD